MLQLRIVLRFVTIICLITTVLSGSKIESAEPAQFVKNLRAGQTQTVVTYGTSLTQPGAWPSQLHRLLWAEFPGQITIRNRGISGSSSDNANPVFSGLGRLEEQVLVVDPDAVLLEFSINDAFVNYNITLQQSKANLETMIDRLVEGRPDREIILMTMNPAWDPPGGGNPAALRPALADYYQIYRDVAQERNLRLIDNYANWDRLRIENPTLFERYLPDGLHPTFPALADVVTPHIFHVLTVPEPSSSLIAVVSLAVIVRRRRR